MSELVDFYPRHIETEDRRFFAPCMKYFTREEQAKMLEEFRQFDKELIHEKYRALVDWLENKRGIDHGHVVMFKK